MHQFIYYMFVINFFQLVICVHTYFRIWHHFTDQDAKVEDKKASINLYKSYVFVYDIYIVLLVLLWFIV